MTRLHRRALFSLTCDIVNGIRQPGSVLPREVDLARAFELSRGTARETIRALEERGLVSVVHGRGATVTKPRHWDRLHPDVLGAALNGPSRVQNVVELLECRRTIEVAVGPTAATSATAADIETLAGALERMESVAPRATTAGRDLFHAAEMDFHTAVVATGGNATLAGLVERLHSAQLLADGDRQREADRHTRSVPEHYRVLRGVEQHEPTKTAQALDDHFIATRAYVVAGGDVLPPF